MLLPENPGFLKAENPEPSDFKLKVSGWRNIQSPAALWRGWEQHQFQPDYKAPGHLFGVSFDTCSIPTLLPYWDREHPMVFPSLTCAEMDSSHPQPPNVFCFLLTSHGCLQIQAWHLYQQMLFTRSAAWLC